jgi:antitoxin component YwqK of YwqJK toxin-antitoxin module
VKKAEGIFFDEKKDSLWIYYNEKGEKIAQSVYRQGKLHGPSLTFYPGGSVCEDLSYKDDKKEGSYKSFFENGKLKEEGQYKNNMPDGRVVYYHPNGQKSSFGDFVSGVKSGTWYYYDENGIPTFSEVFKSGAATSRKNYNGMFEETYSNGTPRCKFHLKNGKKDGPYIEYYETAGFVYERVESKDGYPEEVVQKIKGIQIRVSGNYKAGIRIQ